MTTDLALDRAERLGGDAREIPARTELGDLDVQLDKLTALVAQFEDRLDWVRLRRERPEGQNAPEEPMAPKAPVASQLIADLRHHAGIVKRLQERLSVLLAELEI